MNIEQIIANLDASSNYHGFSTSADSEKKSLYDCYRNILNRTGNPNHPRYADYGGRGIECRFDSFIEFAQHVGFRPSSMHSIDRIDNDGHYEPGNLRWATVIEQNNNKRVTRRFN